MLSDVQGYSDKQQVLLTKIMDKLTNFQVSQQNLICRRDFITVIKL
jgi:hypothetical protein